MAEDLNTPLISQFKLYDATERLRPMKAATEAELQTAIEAGRAEGIEWAACWASYEQLARLAELDLSGWLSAPDSEPSKLGPLLDRALSAEQFSIFSGVLMHDTYPGPVHVRGFVEGALQVWTAVKSRL